MSPSRDRSTPHHFDSVPMKTYLGRPTPRPRPTRGTPLDRVGPVSVVHRPLTRDVFTGLTPVHSPRSQSVTLLSLGTSGVDWDPVGVGGDLFQDPSRNDGRVPSRVPRPPVGLSRTRRRPISATCGGPQRTETPTEARGDVDRRRNRTKDRTITVTGRISLSGPL